MPSGIALKEELPKLRQNPGARSSAGFEAVRGDQVYPLTAINWSQYGPGNFPFQLRQRPGPSNALGRAKFMFPNKFNVYLHDTPAKSFFERSERAFSHGCIRLSRPIDLAEQVLSAVPGWDRGRIDGVIASGDRTVVNLTTPLPIHITYLSERAFSHGCIRLSRPIDLAEQVLSAVPGWDRGRIDGVIASGDRTVVNLTTPLPIHITYLTAWVDDGIPNFRRDIYDQDVKLLAALEGQSVAW